MRRTASFVVITLLILTLASVAHAQTPAPPPSTPPVATRSIDRNELRRHVYVMEGALVRAVLLGGQSLSREIKSFVPEMMAVSGEPQARGVYLEGYGVFFDVGVPVLHQSMAWTIRTMLGSDNELIQTIEVLKQQAKTARNPAERTAIDNTIRRLELQRNPFGGQGQIPQLTFPGVPAPDAGAGLGTTVASTDAPPKAMPPPERTIDFKYLADPNAINRAYTEAVQRALMDTMIDLPMRIAPDEFLTVAARDNMPRDSLAPFDPYEEVVTVLLRIRGSDLTAYRNGQIDREEVLKRVLVREF
jgi:hypothetical protein